MGSGAFLVEACRALGERLVKAWARWPETRPKIPDDEDDHLHARRLVAQRCLYGVDKNPRAVDLAKLSLWLATLARDHEFTFLDHALKCGDSLVGLTAAQIAAINWDESKPGLPLFRKMVRDSVADAMRGRTEIQAAPDDTVRAIQEVRHRSLEARLAPVRILGDAVLSAYFGADKPRAREKARAEIESSLTGSLSGNWKRLEAAALTLHQGTNPIAPFHWQVEFPEVFALRDGGFDAVVGNPPFIGGTRISTLLGVKIKQFLTELHPDVSGRADIVAHFFRRSFDLIKKNGAFGLVATNTIAQGATRAGSLRHLVKNGAQIFRALRRYRWPGDAAVVVSVVHVLKGSGHLCLLNNKPVGRVSAFLVSGNEDDDPIKLAQNNKIAFLGHYVLGMGFTFDDTDKSGASSPISALRAIQNADPRTSECVFPYLGGEEINTSPSQLSHRYVIYFDEKTEAQAREWPQLFSLIEQKVKPERLKQDETKYPRMVQEWWKFWNNRSALQYAIRNLDRCIAIPRVSTLFIVAMVSARQIFSDQAVVVARSEFSAFAAIACRTHELWAWSFSSSMKDDLRYTPSECFRTFPFPNNYQGNPLLEVTGENYHNFRAELMKSRNEGLTKTYNRFHARSENAADITRLRELHAEMDATVLRAYGWDDLADRAAPEFIEQDADEGKTPKTRLDWPAEFKDEVLARLLALNAERAAAERAAGVVAAAEADEEEPAEADD